MIPPRKEHAKKLVSVKFGLILRVSALASMLGLLLFVFGLPDNRYVRAAPLFQGTPGYEAPTEQGDATDTGYYPPETETPVDTLAPDDTETPNPNPSPTIELTAALTGTEPPDVFRTEDTEINGAQTTPLVTETPGQTITPYNTPTRTKKAPRTTLASTAREKKQGFTPDWGLFWIGFSVPVLGACGVVLYLLDRRPDLFKRGK